MQVVHLLFISLYFEKIAAIIAIRKIFRIETRHRVQGLVYVPNVVD